MIFFLWACVSSSPPPPSIHPAPLPSPVEGRFVNGYNLEEQRPVRRTVRSLDFPVGVPITVLGCYNRGLGHKAECPEPQETICDYEVQMFGSIAEYTLEGRGLKDLDLFPEAPAPDGGQRLAPFSKYRIVFSDGTTKKVGKEEYIRIVQSL